MVVSIGTCLLGTYPKVVAIVDRFIAVEDLLLLKKSGVDLLEIRVDLIDAPFDKIMNYLCSIKDSTGLPMIGTIRENERTVEKRVAMFKEIVYVVDAIDVELGSPVSDTILSNAKDATVIISEHDYQKTPTYTELRDMITRACMQGADIVKLSVMSNSRDDVHRLLKVTQECSVPLVTIGMGPIGTVTRVIAPLYGSLFTFGFIGDVVAPGQLPVGKLIEEIRLYYP
ncbi:MAG TPA: type I 3-dehydroquinate dehydratase [Chitinispirillaceae bacterium]|nr:type I 3-dehydroquinate dehydratase [Chitinispirillaceae bacterium]